MEEMIRMFDEDNPKYLYDAAKHQMQPYPPTPPIFHPAMPSEANTKSSRISSDELRKMIMSRMRGKMEVDYYYAYQLTDEKIVCFVIHKEQAIIIEDEAALFPSDQFITKLRLLLG